jgi:hypothetical protein
MDNGLVFLVDIGVTDVTRIPYRGVISKERALHHWERVFFIFIRNRANLAHFLDRCQRKCKEFRIQGIGMEKCLN